MVVWACPTLAILVTQRTVIAGRGRGTTRLTSALAVRLDGGKEPLCLCLRALATAAQTGAAPQQQRYATHAAATEWRVNATQTRKSTQKKGLLARLDSARTRIPRLWYMITLQHNAVQRRAAQRNPTSGKRQGIQHSVKQRTSWSSSLLLSMQSESGLTVAADLTDNTVQYSS